MKAEKPKKKDPKVVFDEKITKCLCYSLDKGVEPEEAILVAINNLTEFGLYTTNGAAPLVAIAVLKGMSEHLKKYDPTDDKDALNELFEISIDSEWLRGSNGNLETRFLLDALANHIVMMLDSREVGIKMSREQIH